MKTSKSLTPGKSGSDPLKAILCAGEMSGDCSWGSIPDPTWIDLIRKGLPGESVATLARKINVPKKDLAGWLHTTPRTLQRHIMAKSILSPDLSDRLMQLIRVFCRAKEVFQDDAKASSWLKNPNFALGDKAPTALLDTIPGTELVLDELGRIEHGVFI